VKRAALALVLVACGASEPVTEPARSPSSPTPLAALLASTVCGELEERPFALASSTDGIIDTYALVKRCRARAERDALVLETDAYAWIAVDRDLGAFALRSFVHATLHASATLRTSARDTDGRLAVSLASRGTPSVVVEPVGMLDPTPQNWASFLALELAPSAGVSPEALAKTRLKEELERTLGDALAKPLVVAYDPKSGAASSGVSEARGERRLRVAPHGTALVGPFAKTAAPASIRMTASASVAVRAICTGQATRVLDADRRGDEIAIDEWISFEKERAVAVPAMPCAWMLAVRASGGSLAIVDLERPSFAPAPSGRPPDAERWVSLDSLAFTQPLEDPTLIAIVDAGVREHALRESAFPEIVVLAPDETIRVRLVRHVREEVVSVAEATLPLDEAGAVERAIELASADGRTRAELRLRARVRTREVR
jgi:hypothetical protein